MLTSTLLRKATAGKPSNVEHSVASQAGAIEANHTRLYAIPGLTKGPSKIKVSA
jgi:hypothetical protein